MNKSAFPNLFVWLLATAFFLGLAMGRAAETPRTFTHPERIHYDGHCLTIEGKDIFIYSGAFHYFRCPKELWRDRFQKIHDAGFNAVESYVPWNWHERQMPTDLKDFSKVDLTDLDDWLKMAEEFGFYIIIRPGPYICAEWDTGGYPQWLFAQKPSDPLRDKSWLRSDDPVYLAWCKHWYDAVCPVIARHQITAKAPGQPGIILVQLENEYDFANLPADVMLRQVTALGEAAHANGIDLPFLTCWTHPVRGQTDPLMRQIFDSCNFYPRWNVDSVGNDIRKLRREQPDAPLMTTELQGGWFAQVGGKLSEDQDGVTASEINNLTLFVIQNGETAMNYYMIFGGTNPGDWAARSLLTSYDYNAPIREWGGVGERYQRVWALGHMLREHGPNLTRAEAVECDVTVPQKDVTVVMRRAQDGSRYLFVRTSQHTEPRSGTARVKEKTGGADELVFPYNLEPFGAKVLYLPPGVNSAAQGEWLPKPAPAIERPANLPSGVVFTSALRRDDSGPSSWSPLQPGENLVQAGIYNSRFVFYRGAISSPAATNMLVEFPNGDAVLAAINGKTALRVGGAPGSSLFPLPSGSNQVELLYENAGHANIGSDLERMSGVIAARLSSSNTFGMGKSIAGWRMHEVNGTENRSEVEASYGDDDWTPVTVDQLEADNLASGETAVYRAYVEMGETDLREGDMVLSFGRIDDLGWVYVNGQKVGQTFDWSREYSFDVTKQLHAGRNSIAVIIRNNDGAGGLGAPAIGRASKDAVIQLDAIGAPAGVEGQWWNPALNDTNWQAVVLGAGTVAMPESLLAWYRLKFELPATNPAVWVPWRLRLNATGNGFLYLNGHPLGRYWEAGPQHDFFLPECWLNFGSGQSNVLALSLRPGEKGAAIQSATVLPYAEFAEKR